MNSTVRDFLIRSQTKVIEHYRQVLGAQGIPELERQSIQTRLAKEESALDILVRPPEGSRGYSP